MNISVTVSWAEDTATEETTRFDVTSFGAIEDWVTERGLYLSDNLGNYHSQSWDVREDETDLYVGTLRATR